MDLKNILAYFKKIGQITLRVTSNADLFCRVSLTLLPELNFRAHILSNFGYFLKSL